jgi:retron-type reverse transcriptase
VASPLLANIYLHYAFDLWVRHCRKHHATGDVIIVRYADDIVAGFVMPIHNKRIGSWAPHNFGGHITHLMGRAT